MTLLGFEDEARASPNAAPVEAVALDAELEDDATEHRRRGAAIKEHAAIRRDRPNSTRRGGSA
jgi:hypothetical protein